MFLRIHFVCLVAGLVLLASCKPPVKQPSVMPDILILKAAIEKQIKNEAQMLSDQLSAFSKEVASDRDFAMKLIAENNRSAPEVTDFAGRFIGPMGFSLLEIVDSANSLLSSGQFPASAGTSVDPKAALLGDSALFIFDDVKGRKMLTIQKQVRFKILEASFGCIGGRIVDEAFVSRLSPGAGFRLILKQGENLLGINAGDSIPDSKDSSITVNGNSYPAVSFSLPFAGTSAKPVFILMCEKEIIHQK